MKERFKNLQIELDKEFSMDSYSVIKKFLERELNVKDFSKKQVLQRYAMFVSADNIDLSNEETMEEIDSNLNKLSNSLKEYKYYLKCKFIIDDIKQIYEKNKKIKNQHDKIKRQIITKEKSRVRLNNKIDKQALTRQRYLNKRKYTMKRYKERIYL